MSLKAILSAFVFISLLNSQSGLKKTAADTVEPAPDRQTAGPDKNDSGIVLFDGFETNDKASYETASSSIYARKNFQPYSGMYCMRIAIEEKVTFQENTWRGRIKYADTKSQRRCALGRCCPNPGSFAQRYSYPHALG
ncbi:MAG: hypothetical protein A2096_12145 [Spirochaetes bacterium GWF1_41_5]|nr:MAG: hypothetical protein A2096_12145 [Spirochaetes bacterium GWF1_41_5]HBE03743.1 hypothetical protein [Spirochaetia bacterium]